MLDMSRPLDGLPASPAGVGTSSPEAGIEAPRQPVKRASAAASENPAGKAPDHATRSQPNGGAGVTTEHPIEVAEATSTTRLTDASDAAAVAATTPGAEVVSFRAAPATKTATVATPQALPEAPGGAGAIGGAVFALLLVVGLILALAWLAKRMPGVAGSSNTALRVVGSLSLGPRERVVVVAVGDTQLLLSVGAGGTRTLHTLDTPLATADTAPSPFAQMLAQHFGKKA